MLDKRKCCSVQAVSYTEDSRECAQLDHLGDQYLLDAILSQALPEIWVKMLRVRTQAIMAVRIV